MLMTSSNMSVIIIIKKTFVGMVVAFKYDNSNLNGPLFMQNIY